MLLRLYLCPCGTLEATRFAVFTSSVASGWLPSSLTKVGFQWTCFFNPLGDFRGHCLCLCCFYLLGAWIWRAVLRHKGRPAGIFRAVLQRDRQAADRRPTAGAGKSNHFLFNKSQSLRGKCHFVCLWVCPGCILVESICIYLLCVCIYI